MKRILVVDDEPDICSNLADILSEFGYFVDTCTSPREALRKAHDQHYDLAVLDLRMPGMNGVELFRELRRNHPSTEGVLVTAFAEKQATESATEEGIRNIFPKPVDVPRLLSVLRESRQ